MLESLKRFQDDNHEHPAGPLFRGDFAGEAPSSNGTLTVVTYNIDFGLEVDLAIEAFQSQEPLRHADIILLQEMDETGTKRMAQALGHNYVYCPASARRGRNFGNAILARWPLSRPRKLILPHRHPIRGQSRIATQAVVRVESLEVAVYSTHTETYTVPATHRAAQIEAIVDDIGSGEHAVIVGGDFNTVSRRSILRMTAQFAEAGLTRVSAGAGPTVARLGVQATAADHIFTRGLAKRNAGKLDTVEASDHFPLWVDLVLPA